jgi:hypothetical protein
MWLVVNVMPRPLYPRERPGGTLHRRVGGPQSRSGWVREILPPTRSDPRTVHPLSRLELGTFLISVTTVRHSVATLGGLVASGGGGGAKAGKVSGRISMSIGILTKIRAMSSGNPLCQQILLPTCTWWSICSVVNSSSKPGRVKGELPAP